jgi:hypothetical protein
MKNVFIANCDTFIKCAVTCNKYKITLIIIQVIQPDLKDETQNEYYINDVTIN